jgi:hypothetical protein
MNLGANTNILSMEKMNKLKLLLVIAALCHFRNWKI